MMDIYEEHEHKHHNVQYMLKIHNKPVNILKTLYK